MAKRTITPELRSAQEKSFSIRKLKVRQGFYDHQFIHKDPRFYTEAIPVPWVQIKGYWMNKAGFHIGTAIQVKVYFGCIILKAIRNL